MKGETVDLAILALRLSALGAANVSSLGGLDEPMVRAMFRRLDSDLERIAELHEKEIAAHLAKASQPVEAVDVGRHLLQAKGSNRMTRRIYLDLDGVMADFDGTFPAVFGLDHRDMADDDMWLKINGHPSFFRDLPPMEGALEFFRSIEHLNPIILTACPKSNYAHVATQKVEWVRHHLSAHVTVLPVLGGSSKPLFMHAKGDILIDDFRRNTEAWAVAGGHAILHRGFDGTAAALEQAICPYGVEPAQPVEAVDEDSREFVLRAMAMNYSDRHAWDHLDADACRRGADEIKALRAALAHPRPAGDAHPDDLAVDAFASSMKEKLAAARTKGRGGWNTDDASNLGLSIALRNHVEKGDPRDVANFAMFLYQRGESILPSTTGEQAGEVAWIDHTPSGVVLRTLGECKRLEDLPHGTKLYALPHRVGADTNGKCNYCNGATEWFTSLRNKTQVVDGRLKTSDVECVFVLGCTECGETLEVRNADAVAASMTGGLG